MADIRAFVYLKGKQVHKQVLLMLWTDIPTKESANVNGYTKLIEDAGAHLPTSGCPLVIGPQCHRGISGMAMDGAKQAHYIRSESKAKVYYGSKYQCIDAAISGKWEVAE